LRGATTGKRAALASLLMLPALVISFLVAEFAGSALQSALGLAENESLTNAGALGDAAATLLVLILVLPPVVGLKLGLKARRQGARRAGTTGVVINGAVAAFALLSTAVNLLLA
jgi:hypothetical protein